MTDERRRLHIDWVQATAGALTAVSSAVLLSTVGVAGTLIGAAVGSVVATFGNAVYGHYLALSKERVGAAKVLAAARLHQADTRMGRARVSAQVGGARADHELDVARHEVEKARLDVVTARQRARVSWREALRGLPWKRIVPVAAGVFALAMMVILSFELVTGRAVSTYTGGTTGDRARTSIPGLGGDGSAQHTPTRTPSSTPTTSAPQTSGPAAPSASATPQPSPLQEAPSTPSESQSLTEAPTPAESPTAPEGSVPVAP